MYRKYRKLKPRLIVYANEKALIKQKKYRHCNNRFKLMLTLRAVNDSCTVIVGCFLTKSYYIYVPKTH